MQADEEIQLLVARRGQIKAKITRFNNFLDENAQPDYTNLTIRLDKLKETYDSFDLTQERLEILQPTEPQHAIERENFENWYFQAFTRGSCVLQTLESLLQPQVKVERQTRETLPTKRLILPKIEIPKFSGELEK